MAREAAVAGAFYSGSRGELVRQIEKCFLNRLGPGHLPEPRDRRLGNVLGLVAPHAGYMYSGPAAAFAYDALAQDGIPDVAVILGPNHHALGAGVAVAADSDWETPLGVMPVDGDTARAIVSGCRYASLDDSAHVREHSIEVQIPFLQYIGGDRTKIVPIAISHLNQHDAAELTADLGRAIAGAIEGKSAVVIASTDFTHYESQAVARTNDQLALDRIVSLDAEGLIRTVYENSITMCGVIGTAVMTKAVRLLSAKQVRKLTYYTSGEVTGDHTQVVGYAALSAER
jgi:AmmeMemoRadiSam system protein B